MNKKFKKAYISLFNYIQRYIFELNAKSFTTDFETSLKVGLHEVYPNAILKSCWFHFCQALRRNVSSTFKHLAELLRSNKTASIYFHKFVALPLLSDFIMLQKNR